MPRLFCAPKPVQAARLLTLNIHLSHDQRPCQGGSMRLSLDWWAVLAAAVAVILIKTGLVAGIPW
jgi:hypothetical protein